MAGPNGNGDLASIPDDLVEQIAKKAGPDAVFGDPMVHGGVALIPVVTVSYGGGGGAGKGEGTEVADAGSAPSAAESGKGEGGGYGFGVKARPVGTIQVTNEGAVYKPIVDYSRLAAIWSIISGIALLTLVVGMVFGGRRD